MFPVQLTTSRIGSLSYPIRLWYTWYVMTILITLNLRYDNIVLSFNASNLVLQRFLPTLLYSIGCAMICCHVTLAMHNDTHATPHLPSISAGTKGPTRANTAAATAGLCSVILPLSRWAISAVCAWKLRSNPFSSAWLIQVAHSRALSRPSMLL